jgi:hypothetical protein
LLLALTHIQPKARKWTRIEKKRKKKTTHTHKKNQKQTNKHTTYIAMSILTERKTENVYITIRKNVSL